MMKQTLSREVSVQTVEDEEKVDHSINVAHMNEKEALLPDYSYKAKSRSKRNSLQASSHVIFRPRTNTPCV